MRKINALCTLFAMSLLLSAGPSAQAATILSTSGGSTWGYEDQPTTVGWAFVTPSTPMTVTALDAILNNFITSANVRLYDGSGTILASATVTTSDPTVSSGLTWYSHAITPVALPTNTTLYIAQDIASGFGTVFYYNTSAPVMSNGFTYGSGGVLSVSALSTGQKPTTDSFVHVGNPGYFGPNFDAVPTPVPLPAAVWAGATTLVGLAGWARMRRKLV